MTDLPETKCPACAGRGCLVAANDTRTVCPSCDGRGVYHSTWQRSAKLAQAAAAKQLRDLKRQARATEQAFRALSYREDLTAQERNDARRKADVILNKGLRCLDEIPEETEAK